MLVKDVLLKFHNIVPFDWTIQKIKKAGLNPTQFLIEVGRDLERCDDINTTTGKEVLKILKKLERRIL